MSGQFQNPHNDSQVQPNHNEPFSVVSSIAKVLLRIVAFVICFVALVAFKVAMTVGFRALFH